MYDTKVYFENTFQTTYSKTQYFKIFMQTILLLHKYLTFSSVKVKYLPRRFLYLNIQRNTRKHILKVKITNNTLLSYYINFSMRRFHARAYCFSANFILCRFPADIIVHHHYICRKNKSTAVFVRLCIRV